jgi:uncharacterized repeat protein (TIGR02543 family)
MYFTDGNANIGRFPLADNLVSITSLVTSPNASSAWDIALIDMPSVTYANGGALTGSVPTDSSSPYSLGSTVTVLGNTGTLARPGYTFSGWQLNMGGVLSTPAIGTTFTVTTDATLTAQWTVVTTTTAATTTTLAPTTTTIAPTQNVAQIVTTTTSTLPTSATTTVPSGAQSNTDSSTPMPTTGSDMLRFIPLSIAMAALGAWLVRRSQMNSLQ